MIELLYAALHEPYGLIIETDDFVLFRQKLYAVRSGLADLDLEKLSFVQSPTEPNQLWIVKTDAP
jgi:hypothetical protein